MRAKTFTGAGRIEVDEAATERCAAREGLSQVGRCPAFPLEIRASGILLSATKKPPGVLKAVCRHDAGLITNLGRDSMFTAKDIILVQASFARVVPMQDTAADLFYVGCSRLRRVCANCFRLICAIKNES